MKKIILLSAITLTTALFAQPNMQKGEGVKKLAQMAGEKSPYYRAKKEAFPKDYFLVNQNLPFLVGVALFHPNGDKLNLTKEQLDKIVAIKNSTVPPAAKIAKEIKSMELQLAKAMIDEHKDPKSQYELVDKISKLRTDLTKGHLKCIYDMQNILSPEQFKTLISLAKQHPRGKQSQKVANSTDSKGEELFKQKCATCHTLGKPTDISKVVAPPLNGIMRHVKMSYNQEDKAVEFIKDYVINPNKSKAVCMPQKIERFGLMPSQKGMVTSQELDSIAKWMFENYPQKGFVGHGKGMGMMKHQ